MPGVVIEMMRKRMAILGFIARETTENNFVWHPAQTVASTIRRK